MTEDVERDGADVVSCRRCPALADARTQIVNGTGPADADLLFVGEAPGETEDRRGAPFVGRSGDVLDSALASAGLGRDAVRITNCVRCRPPENRDPHTEELANCRGHLDNEVRVVDPELVVTLGKVPSEHLLDRSVSVTQEAGDLTETTLGGESRTVLVSVHPAATLYDPSQRETFERTVREAASLVGGGDQTSLGEF
jgi:DNA polymerase